MAVAALSAVERIRKREEEKRIKCNKRKQEWYQRKKEMNAKNKETKPVSKESCGNDNKGVGKMKRMKKGMK
jgi:hypothetical protein